jgi:hypothetical protein
MVNKLGNFHRAKHLYLVSLTTTSIETLITTLTIRKTVTQSLGDLWWTKWHWHTFFVYVIFCYQEKYNINLNVSY